MPHCAPREDSDSSLLFAQDVTREKWHEPGGARATPPLSLETIVLDQIILLTWVHAGDLAFAREGSRPLPVKGTRNVMIVRRIRRGCLFGVPHHDVMA